MVHLLKNNTIVDDKEFYFAKSKLDAIEHFHKSKVIKSSNNVLELAEFGDLIEHIQSSINGKPTISYISAAYADGRKFFATQGDSIYFENIIALWKRVSVTRFERYEVGV